MTRAPLLALLAFFAPSAFGQSLTYRSDKVNLLIERSVDQGAFWAPYNQPLYGDLKDLSQLPINDVWRTSSMIVAVGDGGTVVRSKDGKVWTREKTGTWESLRSIWGEGDSLFTVGSTGVVLSSGDAGKTWRTQQSGTDAELEDIWGRSINELYITTSEGLILRSTDTGKTWAPNTPATDLSYSHSIRAVWGGSSQNVFAVGRDGLILRSTDGGDIWKQAKTDAKETLNAVWGSSSTNIYAVGSAGLILRSTDGTSWHKEESKTNANLVAIWGNAQGDVFILGETALLHLVDGEWEPLTLPRLRVKDEARRWSLVRWVFHRDSPSYKFVDVEFRGIWGSSRESLYIVGKSGAIFHSTDGAVTWSQQESNTDETIRSVWGSSPNNLFAAGKRVQLRSTDSGETWQAEARDQSLRVVWGVGSAVYAAGNGDRISRSSNAGASWSASINSTSKIFGLWGDGTQLFAAGEGVILRSKDGVAWSPCPSNGPLSQIWGTKSDIFVLGYKGALLRSTDGLSWKQELFKDEELADLWGDGRELFLLGDFGPLYYSPDNGASWTKKETGVGGNRIWGRSANELYLLQDAQVLSLSTDRGDTWTALYQTQDEHLEGIFGFGKELYLFGFEMFLSSRDNGKTWKGAKSEDTELEDTEIDPVSIEVQSLWSVSKNALFLLSFEGEVFFSKDGGKQLQRLFGLDKYPGDIWASSTKNVYVIGDEGIYHSTNGGTKWKKEEAGTDATLNAIWGNTKQVLVVGGEGTLLRSTDGKTWKQIPLGIDSTLGAIWGNESGIFITGDDVILRSKDGENWEQVHTSDEETLTAVHGSASRIYVVGDEVILSSVDGGSKWSKSGLPVDELYLHSVWVAPSGAVCVLGNKLLCSSDGETWGKGLRPSIREINSATLWGVGEDFYLMSPLLTYEEGD